MRIISAALLLVSTGCGLGMEATLSGDTGALAFVGDTGGVAGDGGGSDGGGSDGDGSDGGGSDGGDGGSSDGGAPDGGGDGGGSDGGAPDGGGGGGGGSTDSDGDGWTSAEGDCDDGDASLTPDDRDGDGYSTCDGDCDDGAATTFPGAAEDESATACMKDADNDGWGAISVGAGVTAGDDCDDGDLGRNPGVTDEPWDGDDQDCDGSDAGSVVTEDGGGDLPIIDFYHTNSIASVSGCDRIYDIEITVDITHTYIGDLELDLASPSGTVVRLHDRTGGAADDIAGVYAVTGGSLSSEEPVSDFLDTNGTGTWTLTATDLADQDTGRLNSWSMTLACP